MMSKQEVWMRQAEAAKQRQRGPGHPVSQSKDSKHPGVQNITFANPKASGKFYACGCYLSLETDIVCVPVRVLGQRKRDSVC